MIRLQVNGKKRRFDGPPFTRLIDVLREELALTGTKEGCGEGECGACTVLLDGEPVNSCLVPVFQAHGHEVETVEALGTLEHLAPIQQSFLTHGGAQCGICTPGMLMTAWAYLRDGGPDDVDSVRTALAGNLCRCTGYQHIVEAVVETARARAPRKEKRGTRTGGPGGPDPRERERATRAPKRRSRTAGPGGPDPRERERATRAPKRRSRTK
jgi:carbon-monoxide dehydrogenase small subunit